MRENSKIIEDIKKVLDKVRPYLNSEGGDLEFLGFKDAATSPVSLPIVVL